MTNFLSVQLIGHLLTGCLLQPIPNRRPTNDHLLPPPTQGHRWEDGGRKGSKIGEERRGRKKGKRLAPHIYMFLFIFIFLKNIRPWIHQSNPYLNAYFVGTFDGWHIKQREGKEIYRRGLGKMNFLWIIFSLFSIIKFEIITRVE